MRQAVQLLVSRSYLFLDSESLEERCAYDSLFRCEDGTFLLHMSAAENEDRIVWLDSRSALAWINASPDEFGLEWE
jgi:hypothetical protein